MKKFAMALIVGIFALGAMSGCGGEEAEATATPADTSVAPGNAY